MEPTELVAELIILLHPVPDTVLAEELSRLEAGEGSALEPASAVERGLLTAVLRYRLRNAFHRSPPPRRSPS